MLRASIFVVYENESVAVIGISVNGKRIFKDLYRKGNNRKLIDVINDFNSIKELVSKFFGKIDIICNDIIKFINAFDIVDAEGNFYDISLRLDKQYGSFDDYIKVINLFLDKLDNVELTEYNKLKANASFAYNYLNKNGLMYNYDLVYPNWSLETFTGRSKSCGFNIQGFTDKAKISNVKTENGLLLHFDWICADIRIASILSNDSNLHKSFEVSDPYQYLADIINSNSDGNIMRDECKKFLLMSINSMSVEYEPIIDVYSDLYKWVNNSNDFIASNNYFKSILGKVYRSDSKLSIFNASMQGSVAHAMHNVIYKVFKLFPEYIIGDIHDSIILSVPKDITLIRYIINNVVSIMSKPFDKFDVFFPLKVSIGEKWREWELCEVHKVNKAEIVANLTDVIKI